MKEKLKNKLLIAIAIITTVLSVFNLGLMFGQVVYAEDEVDLFPDIDDQYQIGADAWDWFHADFFQNYLSTMPQIPVSPEDDYIFFNTENYYKSGNNTFNSIMSYYFCLGEASAVKKEKTIEWYTGDYFRVYYQGGSGMNGNVNINYLLSTNTYLKGKKLIYDIETGIFTLYILGTNNEAVPYYMPNYNSEDGSFFGVRNFETNITDFDDSLKLEITFNPALEGVVDRSFISDGQTYYKKSLEMTVKNVSNSNVQYSIGIFPASCTTFDPQQAVFVYFRPDMVYSPDLTNEINFNNETVNLMSKNTYVHWLAPGEANYQTFNYSQLPLQQNTQYRVLAIACKTPYMYGSELSINGYEDIYEDLYHINADSYEVVYDSLFSIGFLKDVPYDYKDKSNGVVPYKNYDDFNSNQYSYWEYTDENGDLQSGHNNLWTDKDSFIHNPSDFGGYGDRVISDNYTDVFTNKATGFFAFLQSALLLMPPEINALMTFTVIAVCFVIILKFVRG